MKKLLLASIALGTALAAVSPAMAAEGCGPGFHRGPYGRCHPNGPDAAFVGGPGVALVVGNYYHGHGYWDGHRYWQHRYRDHDDWRYR